MAASNFRSAIAIGSKRSKTAQGYLLCADVPLARTGQLLYRAGELGGDVEPGPDGIIRIDRDPEEVFAPSTIASFNHSAITVDHPESFVFPENWKGLAVGIVQNVRQGTDDPSLLLGDMLITDGAAIDLVEKGQKEVSCGYNSDYEQSTPGHGKQRNIRGNHVALVPRGRCGPICSIGDSAPIDPITGEVVIMSTPAAAVPAVPAAPQVVRVPVPATMSFKDRIMAAFYTKDAAGLAEALATVDAAGASAPGTIEVHLTPPATAAGALVAAGAVPTVDADPNSIGNRMTRLEKGLAKVVKAFKDAKSKDSDKDDDKDDDEEGTETEDGDGDDEEDKDKDKDKGKTEDRRAIFRDHKAKAEILAPGVKLPTLDAAMPNVKFRDAMCAFRKSTLDSSWKTPAGKAAIVHFLDAASKDAPDFKKLSCKDAATIFTGAAAIMSAANMRTTQRPTTDGMSAALYTQTGADQNKRNNDFWAKHGGTTSK